MSRTRESIRCYLVEKVAWLSMVGNGSGLAGVSEIGGWLVTGGYDMVGGRQSCGGVTRIH